MGAEAALAPHRPARRSAIAGAHLLDLIAVAIPTLVAAGLVLYELGSRSLWLDEAATVAIVSQHGAAFWHAVAHDGGNQLAYYLLLHALTGLFGTGAWLIRLPSALAMPAAVALVGALALRLFGERRMAFAAATLTAVNLPLVYWGQNARGYALMVALVVASFYAFACMVQSEHERAGVAAVAYVLVTLPAVYVELIAAVVVAVQLLIAGVAYRDRLRTIGVCAALVALGCVPLLVLALSRGSNQLFWVPKPTLHVVGQAARALTAAGYEPNFHRPATGTVGLILLGALLLAAVGVSVRAARGGNSSALVVLVWLLVPSIGAIIAAKVGVPVELARGTLLVAPAVALALAFALFGGRLPAVAGWSLLAAIVLLRALALAPSYGATPEPWRGVTAYVASAAWAGGGCVAFYPQDGRMPFDYYLSAAGGRRLTPVLPTAPWTTVEPFVEQYAVPSAPALDRIAARCPVLWLIASHQGQRDGPASSRADYARYRALLAALAHHYPHTRARRFGYAARINVFGFSRG